MKDEWTPPAKMERIKQNENDCGARIISSQWKDYMCSRVWKCNLLPRKRELWYAGVLESKGVRCCDERHFWVKEWRLASKTSGWHEAAYHCMDAADAWSCSCLVPTCHSVYCYKWAANRVLIYWLLLQQCCEALDVPESYAMTQPQELSSSPLNSQEKNVSDAISDCPKITLDL